MQSLFFSFLGCNRFCVIVVRYDRNSSLKEEFQDVLTNYRLEVSVPINCKFWQNEWQRLYVKNLLTIFARSRESFGALPSLNNAKSYSFPQPILCPANHILISLSAVQESLLILSIWYTKFSLFSGWYCALMPHVKTKIMRKIKIGTSWFIPNFCYMFI